LHKANLRTNLVCPHSHFWHSLFQESTTMKRFIQRTAFSLASTALMTAAQAHEGHGLEGASHWHSTDAWGFMAAGALVAAILWMKGRK
jgi:hypothetical protein